MVNVKVMKTWEWLGTATVRKKLVRSLILYHSEVSKSNVKGLKITTTE